MTKPWEETWSADGASLETPLGTIDLTNRGQIVDGPILRSFARLAACAPEMARLLLQYEHTNAGVQCRHCLGFMSEKHFDGCEWNEVMKKAGIR